MVSLLLDCRLDKRSLALSAVWKTKVKKIFLFLILQLNSCCCKEQFYKLIESNFIHENPVALTRVAVELSVACSRL